MTTISFACRLVDSRPDAAEVEWRHSGGTIFAKQPLAAAVATAADTAFTATMGGSKGELWGFL